MIVVTAGPNDALSRAFERCMASVERAYALGDSWAAPDRASGAPRLRRALRASPRLDCSRLLVVWELKRSQLVLR